MSLIVRLLLVCVGVMGFWLIGGDLASNLTGKVVAFPAITVKSMQLYLPAVRSDDLPSAGEGQANEGQANEEEALEREPEDDKADNDAPDSQHAGDPDSGHDDRPNESAPPDKPTLSDEPDQADEPDIADETDEADQDEDTASPAPPHDPEELNVPGLDWCPELNGPAGELAHVMYTHSEQQRAEMNCHPILAQAAQEKAQDMAVRDYFGHQTPDGIGPNRWVIEAGFVLPDYYGEENDANSIESIGAGTGDVDEVWSLWMAFETHRTHLLGLDPFFAAQIAYGIGYVHVPDSLYGHYWVVLTAPAWPMSADAALESSLESSLEPASGDELVPDSWAAESSLPESSAVEVMAE
jgi:hypothetical protein